MKSNKEFINGIYEKHEQNLKNKNINSHINIRKVALAVSVCLVVIIAGVSYGINSKVYKGAKMTPTYTSNTNEANIWVGTFNLVWNEFIKQRVGRDIKFADIPENGKANALATELNKQSFTKDMLSPNSYYIKVGKTSKNLKEEIIKDIKKLGITSSILDRVNLDKENRDSYTLYAVLNKEFTFLTPFDRLYGEKFANSEEKYDFFGICNSSSENLNNNIYVSFFDALKEGYPSSNSCGVRLNTKEGDEVILYGIDSDKITNKSFEELYNDYVEKEKAYTGSRTFNKQDELQVPYINVSTDINYADLCSKEIEGTNGLYIVDAIQNINFNLNETGGKLTSEAAVQDIRQSATMDARYFYYTDNFILFLKEKDKEKPYFALRINNTDFLKEYNPNVQIKF